MFSPPQWAHAKSDQRVDGYPDMVRLHLARRPRGVLSKLAADRFAHVLPRREGAGAVEVRRLSPAGRDRFLWVEHAGRSAGAPRSCTQRGGHPGDAALATGERVLGIFGGSLSGG